MTGLVLAGLDAHLLREDAPVGRVAGERDADVLVGAVDAPVRAGDEHVGNEQLLDREDDAVLRAEAERDAAVLDSLLRVFDLEYPAVRAVRGRRIVVTRTRGGHGGELPARLITAVPGLRGCSIWTVAVK